ncbi:MAG: SH3 domain-containing protein [Chloroflexota bacterium]
MEQCACRVISARQATYPHPIAVLAGDELVVGTNDDEWPAFVWCADRGGTGGWVPEQFIARTGDRGHALCDYDAAELTIDVGDTLDVLLEEGGWLWCVDRQGRKGWVPLENVEKLPRR